MNSFQRLVALPQEEYLQLSSMQHVNQPMVQHMSQLDKDYHQIPITKSNPYEQMIKQGSVLEEMKQLKEKIRNEVSLGTPKPYRNRALTLYRSLEPYISLSERGELKDNKQQVYKDSRIEDLIQHAVRDRRRQFTPVAWPEFLNMLRQYNVPKSTLNRDTLDELAAPSRKRLTPVYRSTRKRQPSTRYPDTKFLKDF